MIRKSLKIFITRAFRFLNIFNIVKLRREVDVLYSMLYNLTHDLDSSLDLTSIQTKEAFGFQWRNLKEGDYLLSDPWFKANVSKILFEEEIQIKPEWFKGKDVLDIGCGNGRWSYGFAKLGANITAVDINQIAIDETEKAISDFKVGKNFYLSPVESLSKNLPAKKYDLVFCWGVIHHCKSFNKSLKELLKFVKKDGILYLYLYGRDSLDYNTDVDLFKSRIMYNVLPTKEDKYKFLLKKARGNKDKVHNFHDIYSPLINRRLEYKYVKDFLKSEGFEDIVRTIDHTELFIRAIKGNAKDYYKKYILPKKKAPYWFEHH